MKEKATITTWRSVRKEDYKNGTIVKGKAVKGVLYPDFEAKEITSGKNKGKFRQPDVETKDGFVLTGGGTSLFDKKDVFGTKYWCGFEIPKETIIPPSLLITGPKYNKLFDANHYQIEARTGDIQIENFKGALDNLARNAVLKIYENTRQ